MDQSRFLKTALNAADAAGKIIMTYYHGDFAIEQKRDKTVVTIADREAETKIKEIISNTFPDHSILGEEYGEDKKDSAYTWIIDPIDGTSNFVRGIPLFGTQIALVYGEEVIIGVSSMPAIGERMYAEKGKGAFLNNKPVQVSTVSELSDAMICFGGTEYFEKRGVMQSFVQLLLKTRRQRGFGDCYMYHVLASGKTDIVVEAKISFWDVAAAVCILTEAGGVMTQMDGSAPARDMTTVVATNGVLQDGVLKYFT